MQVSVVLISLKEACTLSYWNCWRRQAQVTPCVNSVKQNMVMTITDNCLYNVAWLPV